MTDTSDIEPEYSAEARPEKVLEEGVRKLREEQQRHDAAMERLRQEREEHRTFWTNALQLLVSIGAIRWIIDHVMPCWTTRTSDRTSTTVGNDALGATIEGVGTCLVILNDSAGSDADADLLRKDFLELGFQVELKRNLSQSDTWNYFNKVGEARYPEKNCFILVFISKGTSEYIKSADGKKIELRKVVEFFHPANAIGLRRIPKLFFFQCNKDTGGKTAWKQDRAPFTPEYKDAFVLCSTHRRFLPTMSDYLGKGFGEEFQEVMSKVADELVRDSALQGSVFMESTLQNKIFFSKK